MCGCNSVEAEIDSVFVTAHPHTPTENVESGVAARDLEILRGCCNHTAQVGGDANELEALLDAHRRGVTIAAKNTQRDMMALRRRLNLLQRRHKFRFRTVAAWCQAQ